MERFTREEKEKLKQKQTFIASINDYELFKDLDNEIVGDIFKRFFEYRIEDIEPPYEKNSVEYVVYRQLRNTAEHFDKNYLDTCKRNSENIKKRYDKDSKSKNETNIERLKRLGIEGLYEN